MPAHFGIMPLASLKRHRESSETLGLLILHDWNKTLCLIRIRIATKRDSHRFDTMQQSTNLPHVHKNHREENPTQQYY